jgi:hypothetical protein
MSDNEAIIDRLCDDIAKHIYKEIRRGRSNSTRVVAKSADAEVDPDLGKRILARRDEILAENAKQRTAKMQPLSPKASAKIARYLAENSNRRSSAPITLAKVSILDDMLDKNADEIAKANANPTLAPNHYADMQKRLALHNQIQIEKAKGKQPHVEHAQPNGGGSGGDDDEPLDKKIARIMKERGWGVDKFDLAASEALKGEPIGSQSKPVNTGQQRGVTGDDLTRPISGKNPVGSKING